MGNGATPKAVVTTAVANRIRSCEKVWQSCKKMARGWIPNRKSRRISEADFGVQEVFALEGLESFWVGKMRTVSMHQAKALARNREVPDQQMVTLAT